MSKGQYTITSIRKKTVTESFSADLLPYLDALAEVWNDYFEIQLPEYIKLANESITPIGKTDKKVYEQLYKALYEALRDIFYI
jgi:hypothetical protein